jgi:hypothetical protein
MKEGKDDDALVRPFSDYRTRLGELCIGEVMPSSW